MTYDIAGRPKKYRNNAVEWNGSQMTKYGRNTYEYDGNNYRVFKQTPTEKTYYNYDGSGNLRFERRGRTEINYIYDAGGIQGMKVTVPTDDPSTYYASSEFYYVKDSLGNIRVILDKSGNIMVEYNYDAWGNFVAEKVREARIGSVTVDLVSLNAFTYRGYYYDKESGLYYLINRYYDPITGRFISPDDVGYLDFESFFGTNRYAYCLDNPVNYIDPEGTFGFWALVAITISAIIIGGSAQVLSNAFAGKTGRDLWRGVAAAAIGSGINALLMCLTAGWSFGLSAAFSGTISALVQTGVDTIETAALGEKIDWGQTGLDLLINTVTATIGNIVGGKIVPTNSKWFQPKHFLSVFRKSYGQKLLMQTVIGGTISGIVNFTRKYIEYGKQYSKRQPKRRSITAIN